MAYLIQQSRVAKGVGVTLIVLLAACTSDNCYKRQVNGNEDYLEAPSLHALSSPSGIILPLQNGDYEIPAVTRNGAVGKGLAIHPPVQPLALLNGFYSQYSGNSAVIQLVNSAQSRDLWSQVAAVIQSKGYHIASRQDTQQSLNTDWILWGRADKDEQYSGRYQISLVTQGYQTSLQVTSLGLRQQDKQVINPALVQRYTVEMLNSVASGLQQLNDESTNHITKVKPPI